MKKILVTLAIFAIVGSSLFAQVADVTASNEIYSETFYKEANGDDPMANRGSNVGRGFWGFRETAEGKATAETWTLQARLRVWLWSLAKTTNVGQSGTGASDPSVHGDNWENVFFNDAYKGNAKNGVRVNFWYRPLAGIEMGIGNDFAGYYQVPAGAMLGIDKVMGYMINIGGTSTTATGNTAVTAANTSSLVNVAPADAYIFDGDNAAGARWAANGFAFNFTKVPNLLVSVNIPFHGIVDEYDFAPQLNAGAHYNIGSNVNVGVTYHGGINRSNGHVFGLYGQFKNDMVRIPVGLTFGYIAKKERTWVSAWNKARAQIDLAPDFTFRNGMQVGLSLSAMMLFGGKYDPDSSDADKQVAALAARELIPLTAGIYYKWPINNAWTCEVRTAVELAIGSGKVYTIGGTKYSIFNTQGGKDRGAGTAGQWYFEPKVTYQINAHNSVNAGFKLRFNFVMGGKEDTRNNYMGYAVPIAWTWKL